ncbi:MAG: hypothetical protein KAJ19_08305 [Gammaproteobacteria bacterium]|nr:hypothetical protein [Gammaproteobacteria bacterium]
MTWPCRNKYNAQRTIGMDGCYYPSKCEAAVADILWAMDKGDEIDGYECQHRIQLPFDISWKVDFLVHTKNGDCFIEAKGMPTAEYRLKLKIYKGSDFEGKLPLFIYGHNRQGVFLKETVGTDGMEPPI